jgi:4-amino-4-deoxy-L-arabinose transferase-like glycosyltransferase
MKPVKKTDFSRSFLYRNRHVLGFFVLGFLLYYFIVFGFAQVPGGLSQPEMDSAILSGNISFPASIVDLPYHALQWLSINIFGLSIFSIRVPSVILALLTGGLMIAAIRNLYHSNAAIITGLVTASSVIFLDIARTGAPMIMSIFLFVLALFAVSQYMMRKKPRALWLVLTVLALVIGAYSPLGIYILVCGSLVAILHPKVRASILRYRISHTVLACLAGLAMLAPLAVAVVLQPSIGLTILGIDNLNVSPASIGQNLATIVLPWANSDLGMAVPLLDFVSIAIAIVGILALLRDRHAARSYLALGLFVVSFVFTIINPAWAYTLFMPMIFLIATGINTLISAWYDLFPVNPLARIFGLVPLTLLVLGLVVSGHIRYVDNNLYNADVVYAHNHVFEAVRTAVNERSAHQVDLVVPQAEQAFYGLLEREYDGLTVTTDIQRKGFDTWIFVPETFDQKNGVPTRTVTGWTRNNNVLIKIYEK